MLLAEADRRMGLTQPAADATGDNRTGPAMCKTASISAHPTVYRIGRPSTRIRRHSP